MQKMLQYEPSKRISAKAALQHPYFDEIRNMRPGMATAGNPVRV